MMEEGALVSEKQFAKHAEPVPQQANTIKGGIVM